MTIRNFSYMAVLGCLAATAQAESDHSAAGGHHASRHVVAAFVGVTDPDDAPAETTLGLEYEYRLSGNWGAGLIAERTDEAHHGYGATVGVALVHYHFDNLRVSAGFGKEWVDDHGSEWLQRIGLAYDIELGPVALAPTISLDFIDGEQVPVYGLAVLKHF